MKPAAQNAIAIVPDLLDTTKNFFKGFVQPGSVLLDLTVGNGHDTLFLAQLTGPAGNVFGFDIQAQAIESTQALLEEHNVLRWVKLYLAGHERLSELLPKEVCGRISAAMFNLGYLPGGAKRIVTLPDTTLSALKQLNNWLAPGGGVSIHIYTGHSGGSAEGEAVIEWASQLAWTEWRVSSHEIINKQQNREVLLLLAKACS